MKKKYHTPDYVIELARKLRKRMTPSEKILWAVSRNRGLMGYKFRRQQPIGRYVVDFVCLEANLVVEIDGSIHDNTKEYDDEKNKFLNAAGFDVLRLSSELVEKDLDTAVQKIVEKLKK
ncbi:DUF559 domain-containing protein [bacterium]|nr:DUF559 domain-containing protein [bacterium]